jgi:hypothetical protein
LKLFEKENTELKSKISDLADRYGEDVSNIEESELE